jgi:hypothetical protein
MRSFVISSPHQMLLGLSDERGCLGWGCGTYGEEEKCYNGFVGKPQGKRQLGRPKRR